MFYWNRNNLACVNVWSTLYIMKQHGEVFKNAGKLKMSDLLFYNPALSEDELRFEAESIAEFLDQAFINTCGAEYEDCNQEKALSDMAGILMDAQKTMVDLAELIDQDYNF